MWELGHKEGWAPKNWSFWIMVLEKTLESPLDCKEIKPVHPKGDQSWIFIGRIDAEAETLILRPSDVKNWLIGKDWRQEEMEVTEDGMFGWHHQLNGHEFEKTPGVSDGQGGLACCSPWGPKESDTTERLSLSCPFSWSCYLTISSSASLFSSCPQSFPASRSFPMSQLFISGG